METSPIRPRRTAEGHHRQELMGVIRMEALSIDPAWAKPFPRYGELLNRPKRYFVFYGGRGGAKSWTVARWLLIEGTRRSLRVLCTRQLQNSMKDSVHQLLCDQIKALKLESYYYVTETEIIGNYNNTRIAFAGLQSLKTDPTKLKSYEGVDVCWIEEAVNVTKSNFDLLDPTIRKAGAKIIMTLNPSLETDFVYEYFIKNEPPPDSLVVPVSYRDNPWFPPSLKSIMLHKKQTQPDDYLHIWEGKCRLTLEGAVYAEEIRQAVAERRITRVPYEPTRPVDTFWDLGHSDGCAIWFAQVVGFERRLIDYYENRQKGPSHYIQTLQAKGYVYGTDFLPHDANYQQFAAEGRTIKQIMKAAGRKVRVIKRPTKKQHTIDACRTIFPTCYFDEQKCADGLQRLRHYRYDVDPDTKSFSKEPLHDENSHGADAFGTLGLFLRDPNQDNPVEQVVEIDMTAYGNNGWMNR
jgi:phage terminase large subunit